MARMHCRLPATQEKRLETMQQVCSACGQRLYAAYHTTRTVTTLAERCRLTLQVRHCRNPNGVRYHISYRPEEEGAWALPHGEFGLDVIALVGMLRYTSSQETSFFLSNQDW